MLRLAAAGKEYHTCRQTNEGKAVRQRRKNIVSHSSSSCTSTRVGQSAWYLPHTRLPLLYLDLSLLLYCCSPQEQAAAPDRCRRITTFCNCKKKILLNDTGTDGRIGERQLQQPLMIQQCDVACEQNQGSLLQRCPFSHLQANLENNNYLLLY